MGYSTAAGTTLAISAASPATFDATGYAALTYTEVGAVSNVGTFGAAFAKVEFQPLKGGKLKLLHLTKKIQDLLAITKLLTVFETYENEEEAIKSF